MRALWGQNQGISRAVKPILSATGSAEVAGLTMRPDCCKRLPPPQADSHVGSGKSRGRISCHLLRPGNTHGSGRQAGPVAEPVGADPVLGEVDWFGRTGACLSRSELAERAMRPGRVVVPQVLGQRPVQVLLVDDQQPTTGSPGFQPAPAPPPAQARKSPGRVRPGPRDGEVSGAGSPWSANLGRRPSPVPR